MKGIDKSVLDMRSLEAAASAMCFGCAGQDGMVKPAVLKEIGGGCVQWWHYVYAGWDERYKDGFPCNCAQIRYLIAEQRAKDLQ